MKYCRYCGSPVSDGARFCSNCGKARTPSQPGAASGNLGAQPGAPLGGQPSYQQFPPYDRPASQAASGKKSSRLRTALLIAIPVFLAVVVCVAGFVWPGWFAGKAGTTDPSASASASASSDPAVTIDPDAAVFNTGSSKAFRINPDTGLTISAPAGALDHDRTFTVTPASMKKLDELQDSLRDAEEDPIVLLDAWDINAGMDPGEFMPGTFTVEINLKERGIPEEYWPWLSAYRMDDEGTWFRYAAEIDGDVLRYESRQNSVDGVVIVPMSIYYADNFLETGGETLWGYMNSYVNVYENGVGPGSGKGWFDNESETMGRLLYCVHYIANDELEQEKANVKGIYNSYLKAAEIEVAEEFDTPGKSPYNETLSADEQKAIKNLMKKEAINRAKENAGNDPEYIRAQERLKIFEQGVETGLDAFAAPETKRLQEFARILWTARDYLKKEIKVRIPTYVMDIYLIKDLGAPGLTVTSPKFGNAYCLFNRNNLDKGWFDTLLLTVTHELFHSCQREYCIVSRSCLKFDEATAQMVEDDAAAWYQENGLLYTGEPRENNGRYWYYYAIPMDYNTARYDDNDVEKDMSSAGYVWCHFIRWLNEQRKAEGKQPLTYHQLLLIYDYFSVVQGHQVLSKMLKMGFGTERDDLDRLYVRFLNDKKQEFEAGREKDKSEVWAYPVTEADPNSNTHITINDNSLAVRIRKITPMFPAGFTGQYAMLLRKADGWSEDDKKLISLDDGVECRYGLFFPVRNYAGEEEDSRLVMEADLMNSFSGSYYDILFMTKMAAPAVALENGKIKVKPQGEIPFASSFGTVCTDSYKITLKADGNEIASEKLGKYAGAWNDGLEFDLAELGYGQTPEDQLPVFTASICECIEAKDGYPECLGPESDEAAAEAPGQFEDVLSVGQISLKVSLDGAKITATEGAQYREPDWQVPNGNAVNKSTGTFRLTQPIKLTADVLGKGSLMLYIYYYDSTGDAVRSELLNTTELGYLHVNIRQYREPIEVGDRNIDNVRHVEWELTPPNDSIVSIGIKVLNEWNDFLDESSGGAATYLFVLDLEK